MHAILKYENKLRNERDPERLVMFLTQEMSRRRAVLDSPLELEAAIEALKFIYRLDMIEKVRQTHRPAFKVSFLDLNNHLMFVSQLKTKISLEEYAKKFDQIRFKEILSDLKTKWIDSEFKLTKEELLNLIDENYLIKFLIERKTKKKSKF